MIFKSTFTNILIVCTLLLFSACQKPISNELSGNESSNLKTSNTSSSEDQQAWLIPILSEYLGDESTIQVPPTPPDTPTQKIATNERLAVPITASVSGTPVFQVSNGFTVNYVSHTDNQVIFDLSLGNDATLEHSNDEIQVDILNSAGQLIGRQVYELTSTFANSQVIVSLDGISLSSFETAIQNSEYTVSSFNSETNKATIDIGRNSSAEALSTLHNTISDLPSSQALKTQGLTAGIRAVAGPNYAYKSDRHRGRSYRALMPTCDIQNDLEKFASDWNSINDLVTLTNASEAHEKNIHGDDVIVVLLDSGVDGEDVFDCLGTPEKDGHGTHIKNIIQALAPNVTLVSKRIFNPDGIASIDNLINTNDLLQALKEIEIDYLIPKKNVILNMSFSAPEHPHHGHDLMFWGALADLYDLYGDQLLIVTSAGNHGLDEVYKDDIFYPAGFSRSFENKQQSFIFNVPGIPNVLSIGSAGFKEGELTTSDYNPSADITDFLAYGVKLCKSDPNAINCPENSLTGSSFSAPVVSAIAALNWQRCNKQPSNQIRNLLFAQSSLVADNTPRLIRYDYAFDCEANPVIPAPKATSVALSTDANCILREEDGQIYCWGVSFTMLEFEDPMHSSERPGLIKKPQGVESWNALVAGEDHLCATSNSSQIYCWGGRVLDYENPTNHQKPYQIINPPEVRYWKSISLRCGIADNDQAYCWDLARESNNPASLPTKLVNPTGVNSWQLISNGCGIADDNQAYCWKVATIRDHPDSINALNINDNPTMVPNPAGVTSWKYVSRGSSDFACGISNTDQAYCWGESWLSGVGSEVYPTVFRTPELVLKPDGVDSWKAIESTVALSCGIGNNDEAYCWGNIDCSFLTQAVCDFRDYYSPSLFNKPIEVNSWTKIFPDQVIGRLICALSDKQEVYCWGLEYGSGLMATPVPEIQ